MTHQLTSWDNYDVYLFDIDGTLLHCKDAIHYFAFCEALEFLSKRPLNLDGVVAHGNTDVGILRDALKLADVPEREWRPRLPDAIAMMGRFVEARSEQLSVTTLPFVQEVLTHLRSHGATLGVATGNLETIGRAKLSCCGLLKYFDLGGYSDNFERRTDVFRQAVVQAKMRQENPKVCVVGDTPEDIRSAKTNGLDVIAVATGIFSLEELHAVNPTWCVSSLGELFSLK